MENDNIEYTQSEAERIMDEYIKVFNQEPPLPIMGNYGVILDIMQDAIIRKQPLTIDEVMKEFEKIKFDQA